MRLPIAHSLRSDWRKIQRESLTSLDELCKFLQLNELQRKELSYLASFPFLVPRRLAQKMTKGNLSDPLFLQFVPLLHHGQPSSTYLKDPVLDSAFCQTKKLLKKYKERALLVTTSACAMHCRYCFRQNFPYDVLKKNFSDEIEQIRNDVSLREVILSGGDPLSLSNNQLASLLYELETIDHIKRLRFHTRFPIGIPERIDEEFLDLLSSTRLQVWFIIHCNHPNELDEEIFKALGSIGSLGIPLLNQSVLLKGVNDDVETLRFLFEQLIDHGIQPYYLHQLDRVKGAEAFEVSDGEGLSLIKSLRALLPGYGVPLFVKEVPFEPSKIPL